MSDFKVIVVIASICSNKVQVNHVVCEPDTSEILLVELIYCSICDFIGLFALSEQDNYFIFCTSELCC